MKILLIEDDSHTSAYVAGGLREQGHEADVAATGQEGLALATNGCAVLGYPAPLRKPNTVLGASGAARAGAPRRWRRGR